MSNIESSAINTATPAVRQLATDLIEQASRRCLAGELEACNDDEAVTALMDWAARRTTGEGLRERIVAVLAGAGGALVSETAEPHPAIEGLMLEATRAGCDRLAEIRATALPETVEEALGQAIGRVRTHREQIEASDLWPRYLAAMKKRDPAAIANITEVGEELAVSRLVDLGLVVLRNGLPTLPTSKEEAAAAQARLQDALLGDVCARLGSYQHPYKGRIQVRSVALSAGEEAMVRAAASNVFLTAA